MIAVDIRGLTIPWAEVRRGGLAEWVAEHHPERVMAAVEAKAGAVSAYMSAGEAGIALGIDRYAVIRMVRRGQLRSVGTLAGGRYLIPREDVAALKAAAA